MKLLRYMLSHGLFILLILLLVLAYYYRAQLFSADINVRIDNMVDKSLAWTEIFKNKEAEKEQESVTAAARTDLHETKAPVSDSQAVPEVALESTDAGVQVSEMPVPEVTDTQDVAVSGIAQVETQEYSEPLNDKAVAATSHVDLLNQARSAFQNGMPEQAIELYEKLSELNPDDPNVHGELGNVFYAQGMWKQAGTAYYEAARRLLTQGEMGQVQYLYRVIQGLDPDSAEKLRGQLGG